MPTKVPAEDQARPKVYELRRENLKKLLAETGAKTQLAIRLGVTQARVTHLLKEKGPGSRPIHEDQAREIEKIMGLAERTLDRDPALPAPPAGVSGPHDMALLEESVRMVLRVATEGNAKLISEKAAAIVRLVYEHSRATGHVDPAFVEQLVKLMR